MKEFIIAIEKLIKERIPDSILCKDGTILIGTTKYAIRESHVLGWPNYSRGIMYYYEFDIANPAFNPEDIIKWIVDQSRKAVK